jgi:hypothetical protein
MDSIELKEDKKELPELTPLELKELIDKYYKDTKQPTSPRKTQDIWRSKCCSDDGTQIDRKFLTFILTSLLSVTVLVFALLQLSLNPESDLSSLWVSLVSTITSLHVPSPLSQLTSPTEKTKN